MSGPVVISGCSGGGKSTLIEALAARGFATIEEPGRRIVREEMAGDGRALPWVDMVAFGRRALEMARADLEAARSLRAPVFIDRGLVDAASALAWLTGEPLAEILGEGRPYHRTVFLVPPWPEIFVTDGERRHGLAAALPEWERLQRDYPALGYETVELPRVSVAERAERVVAQLGLGRPSP